MEFEGQPYIA